jgi:hypothetical protein
MEVCMSIKPDFATMTSLELRAYVLAHRNDDNNALQAYLDKLHTENPDSRVYKSDDEAEAIAEYLKNKRQQEAS